MHLTVLGNGAGGPFHGRHYSAQILQVENQVFLIDCGEGTQMQVFQHRIKADRIRQVFISHLHGDHVFGLIGLVTNWCLKQRSEALEIFSPPGLQELLETTIRVCGVRVPYPLIFNAVDPEKADTVYENAQVQVSTIPLNHRSACCGWLFREKEKPRNMRKEAIETFGIPFQDIPAIKAGGDWLSPSGERIPNAMLSADPPPPLSYAYCSDTAPSSVVAEAVRGVNLLYHEATFTDEHIEEAGISYHSTARQAAEIARESGVGKLLLGHFSGRYSDENQHLVEARAVFTETYASVEGERVEVT